MRSFTFLSGFFAASLMLAPLAAGQWASKTPTPADWAAIAKLPDFTGVWEATFGGGGGGRGRGAGPAGARGTAARGQGQAAARAGRGRGAGLPGPSLTPAYAAKAASQPKPGADAQTTNCLPPGLPEIMSQPYPLEFLMTPGLVTVISEAYTQVRHIYTDGRPLPADPDPTFFGTSIGHWDGNTLVAESVGFEDVPRGINFPHSDKMKIVERFTLTDPDTMTIQTTIEDPEALTMPYSMGTRTLKRHRTWTLAEYICEENNRNFVDASGKEGVNLSNPLAAPK